MGAVGCQRSTRPTFTVVGPVSMSNTAEYLVAEAISASVLSSSAVGVDDEVDDLAEALADLGVHAQHAADVDVDR